MAATAHPQEPAFDTEKAQQFADRMMTAMNHSAVVLMTSIGHRSGLFDAMAGLDRATSAEIAAAAKLDERYVREWLGAMVTGAVVDYHATDQTYRLPPEHAAALTRASVPNNLAAAAQWIPVLAGVEDRIVECFRNGGGVPYEKFPRFHAVMAEDSGQSVLSSIESHILPIVPGLSDSLTRGIRVLDAGCGRGKILLRLAALFPKSRFVGMDLSGEMTDAARAEAARLGLRNVEFTAVDLSTFDERAEPSAFDLITTFDAIHDQAKPLKVLKGIHKALEADGVYLMQDIKGSSHVHLNLAHPMGTFLYTVSCMHCMTVSHSTETR